LQAVYEESGRATQLTSLNKKNMENEQTIDALNKLVQINNELVVPIIPYSFGMVHS
jgi:prefoldin subunit 5